MMMMMMMMMYKHVVNLVMPFSTCMLHELLLGTYIPLSLSF